MKSTIETVSAMQVERCNLRGKTIDIMLIAETTTLMPFTLSFLIIKNKYIIFMPRVNVPDHSHPVPL